MHGSGLTLFVGGLPIQDALERIGTTVVPIGTGASEKAVQAMNTLGVTAPALDPLVRPLPRRVRTRKVGRDPREFGYARCSSAANRVAVSRRSASTSSRSGAPGSPRAWATPTWLRCCSARRRRTGGMRFTGGRHVLVELVDPDSGEPIAAEPGVTGELVYTSVDRECCPLVRFRTRDLVRVTGRAPTGRR